MWNASSSIIVNTGPIKVLIIKLCHCNVLCFLVQPVPIDVILVSNEADLRADSYDSSPMCISCKIAKLFKLFLHRSECEHTIGCVLLVQPCCNLVTSIYGLFFIIFDFVLLFKLPYNPTFYVQCSITQDMNTLAMCICSAKLARKDTRYV